MKTVLPGCARFIAPSLLLATALVATSIPRFSFEELTDRSEVVASGQIIRSWSDWDGEHRFIWTHYELRVSAAYKGSPSSTVTVSEPGGAVGGRGMSVADAVSYEQGDRVVVFLERMPNGYLRTTGWGQGKYAVDTTGHIHGAGLLRNGDLMAGGNSGTSLRTLEGMSTSTLRGHIAARLQQQRRTN